MSWINPFVALLLGLFAAWPLRAETLADALQQAWARQPQAAVLEAREAEARARADFVTAAMPGPASVALGNLNDRFASNRGRDEWEVEVAVPLWLPGQRRVRQVEAADVLAEVTAQRAALRLQLAGELREVWWAVAAARAARDVAQQRLETAQALEADVQRRYTVGDVARVDANLAQNERLIAQTEVLAAEVALSQAEQAYQTLTGNAAPPALIEETLVTSPQDHPQLVALAAATRVAQAKFKVATVTRRDAPELAVRVLRERAATNDGYANAVGVKLKIPFASEGRRRQDMAAAQTEVSQAEAETVRAQRTLHLVTEQARLALTLAEQQLALTQQRRALITDNLQLAEKSYALGEADLPALLRARASNYEVERAAQQQQVARAAAQSRLYQALGVLP